MSLKTTCFICFWNTSLTLRRMAVSSFFSRLSKEVTVTVFPSSFHRARMRPLISTEGETIPAMFVSSFKKYARNEDKLPFDQHCLAALIAPRYLAIGSAQEDLHADPYGEFLSGAHAGAVYKLFGIDTYTVDTPRIVGSHITGAVSYHIRSGVHDQNLDDWMRYWDIAAKIK